MDSEIEKYEKKQIQLTEQIEKLFAEKKILEDKMCVLKECLSLEKVQEKIFQLENKQKILRSLESMVNNLKIEIKPLDYLKQLLQRELMVSTLSTNDYNIEEQTNMESSLLTVNSECAIETFDSLSNVSSEESVMVLSEYDIVSDEEDCNDTENTIENKVMYHEALQMASSVHLAVEIPLSNTESILTATDQMKDINFVQSTSKDTIALINSNSKSEQLLNMCNVLNKQHPQYLKENVDIELECIDEKNTIQNTDQLSIVDKEPLDTKGQDNLLKSMNDSWVKISINKSFESLIENDVKVTVHDNSISKIYTEVECNMFNGQLCSQESESKDTCEIKNIESVNNCVEDYNSENKTHNLVSLTNVTKDDIISLSQQLDTENSTLLKKCDEKKENTDVEIHVQNNELCSQPFESIVNSENKFKKVCNELDHNCKNIDSNNLTCSTDNSIDKIDTAINNLSAYFNNNNEQTTQPCEIVEFDTKCLSVELWKGIHYAGFQNLMSLQLKCISHFINGHNVFVHSYPCVGKSTICFISVLQRIDTSLNVCQAIILVPTIELSLSTFKMIKLLGKFLNISVCIGGKNMPKISTVFHVVICTPCSLCDMIKNNLLCKDFIKMLIIDDADEMLKSNGFFNQMRQILLFFNYNPQLIILSSSKFEEILDFFSDTMPNPGYIIMSDERPPLDSVLQYYVCLSEEWKFDAICELYDVLNLMHSVVYCNTRSKSLRVADEMSFKKYAVLAMNKERNTSQRRLILQNFQSGVCRVLVTTEFLRGENFTDVLWVINYDLPENPKDYVHKIVRPFNCIVKVINFISPNDTNTKDNIETVLNVRMLNFLQYVTDLRVFNLNSSNNSLYNLLEL